MLNVNELNFGSMCKVFQKCAGKRNLCFPIQLNLKNNGNANQTNIVKLFYGSIIPKETWYSKCIVNDKTASVLFNNKENVIREVQESLSSDLYQESHMITYVEKYIMESISINRNEFLDWLKNGVFYEIKMKGNSNKDLNKAYSCNLNNEDEVSIFVAAVIRYCLTKANKFEKCQENMNKRSLKTIPYDLLSYDPHGTVHSKSGALMLKLRNDKAEIVKTFFSSEKCLDFIIDNRFKIKSISTSLDGVEILVEPLSGKKELIIRCIQPTDYSLVKAFIQEYESEFRPKLSWKGRMLSDMAFHGLSIGKWVAYGCFDVEGRLIAYMDYKMRLDGDIEIGIQLTDVQYRKQGFTYSLINILRMKFPNARFFIGTYEENIPMRNVLTKIGFKENLFYDPEQHIVTNLINERINPLYPDNKEMLSNSAYYYIDSLFEQILDCARAYTSSFENSMAIRQS